MGHDTRDASIFRILGTGLLGDAKQSQIALVTAKVRARPSRRGRVNPSAPLILYSELAVLSMLSQDEDLIGGVVGVIFRHFLGDDIHVQLR